MNGKNQKCLNTLKTDLDGLLKIDVLLYCERDDGHTDRHAGTGRLYTGDFDDGSMVTVYAEWTEDGEVRGVEIDLNDGVHAPVFIPAE